MAISTSLEYDKSIKWNPDVTIKMGQNYTDNQDALSEKIKKVRHRRENCVWKKKDIGIHAYIFREHF